MNGLQTLFSVVFGIYFAATVGAAGRHYMFDTTAAAAGDRRALWRCLVGILFLDVLPFLYFLLIFSLLNDHDAGPLIPWRQGLGVLFAGIAGFGIYRILMAILYMKRPGSQSLFVFYSEPGELHREPAIGHAGRHKPEHPTPKESWYVFAGGVCWLAMCLLIFWLTI